MEAYHCLLALCFLPDNAQSVFSQVRAGKCSLGGVENFSLILYPVDFECPLGRWSVVWGLNSKKTSLLDMFSPIL